ncbi:uncharacterized protein LOC130628789 [Hydractinia symbiolongicarpus]|uniref:uncharacterized protein LOC130628789 n=1 Tax=Hydractinia symbiolongicarpus TaxID=13093 RepID=UPI00254B3FEA|nr:uncharacterized protein LOC130628789 [Hydractinia symbiolongicarpus]
MSLVWAALRNAKSRKNTLSAIWLDVANAYAALPHKLILMALRCYGVSESWIRLINAYYGRLWSKSFSFTASSSWQQHFRGIFIGCKLSIILFLTAINCQTQNLLDRCVTALHWAGMGFRPSISRSIVIANGKVLDQSPFCVLQEPIPSINANPVKFLGRTINSTLSDSAVVQQVIVNAIRGHLLLRDSADPLVSDSPPDLKAGHWKVDQTVKSAESQLEFKKILGFHQFGRAGLGLVSHKSVPPIGTHSYLKLVSDVVQDNEEDIYYARAVQLHVQELLSLPQSLSSFCIGATYDTLPSPTNLVKWVIQNDKSCTLCKKPSCNVSNIFGACKLALSQGRFTYRHHTVLRVLVTAIQKFLPNYEPAKPSRCHKICFFLAGTRLPTKKRSKIQGILHLASDWRLL